MTELPRGVRNNNPGNIRHGSAWLGLAARQTDPEFCQFTAPEYGIRALALLLLIYQDRHGLRTPSAIVHRWTATDQTSYLAAFCERCHVAPQQSIDLHDRAVLADAARAIIAQENANYAYQAPVLEAGIEMARD